MRLPERSSGSTSPRFSRHSRSRARLVIAHDDPGIRAADKGTSGIMIRHFEPPSSHDNKIYHMTIELSIAFRKLGRPMKNILGAQIEQLGPSFVGPLRTSCASLGVSLATIHRAESVDGKTAMTFANASAIRRALENAGVELIEETAGDQGPV